MNTSIMQEAAQVVHGSNNIVFFGGAGISTESGIPDFRSADGVYNQKFPYPPEEVLSAPFFKNNPAMFFKFCHEKILKPMHDAKPSRAHRVLAELEKKGKLKAVITQNIDELHQAAGSRNVIELHGTMHHNTCIDCGAVYDFDYLYSFEGDVVICQECGGLVHPGCVLFKEPLDQYALESSISYLSEADVLIVAGTSLMVYPAAGLIDSYSGDKLILIDKDSRLKHPRADFIIHGLAGEVLSSFK